MLMCLALHPTQERIVLPLAVVLTAVSDAILPCFSAVEKFLPLRRKAAWPACRR
jgi:hypothetical protein